MEEIKDKIINPENSSVDPQDIRNTDTNKENNKLAKSDNNSTEKLGNSKIKEEGFKIKEKFKTLFKVVIVFSILGIVYFILTTKPNTKKYSQENIDKLIYLIENKLISIAQQNTKLVQVKDFKTSQKYLENSLNTTALPFSLDYFIEEISKESFSNNINNNRIAKNSEYLKLVYKKFGLYQFRKNQTLPFNFDSLTNTQPLKLYRHINFWILRKYDYKRQEINDITKEEIYYNSLVKRFEDIVENEYSNIGLFHNTKIILKTIYHTEDITSKNLYKDISYYNSDFLIEELVDEGALNIPIELFSYNSESEYLDKHNSNITNYNGNNEKLGIKKTRNIDTSEYSIYNPDFDKYFYRVNLEKLQSKQSSDITYINKNIETNLSRLVLVSYMSNQLNLGIEFKYISEDNLKQYFYFRLLLQSLNNLNTLNVSEF